MIEDCGIPAALVEEPDALLRHVAMLASASPSLPRFQITVGEIFELPLGEFWWLLREQARRIEEATS